MAWTLDSGRPIYLQIVERIELDIISGKYLPGDRLSSVRELAVEAGVNPNTMQKALAELERSGLVHSERTSGRFITEDIGMIKTIRENLAKQQVEEFIERMKKMGFDGEEMLELLWKTWKGEKR